MRSETTKALQAATPDAPPGGIAHLAHAINTTPDAAITDAMRAEAAETARKVDAEQRFGLWDARDSAWAQFGGEDVVFTSVERAESYRRMWLTTNQNITVRPYIAAINSGAPVPTTEAQARELTPPAAPGEWKADGYVLFQGETNVATCNTQKRCTDLATRLNRADAMERALRKCMSLIAPLEATNERLEVFQAAQAALRK